MHKSNCGSMAIGFTAAVFVSKGRNHGISRKTEYLRGDYPKDGSGSPGTAGEDVSGGARIRHGYRASNVPKSLCNSASSLSMVWRNCRWELHRRKIWKLEPSIGTGKVVCSSHSKSEKNICPLSRRSSSAKGDLSPAKSGEEGSCAKEIGTTSCKEESAVVRIAVYYLVCVIPLAQTCNKCCRLFPLPAADCPDAAPMGTGRHWENENHRHLAVCDKSGLLCGKCATE